MNTTKVCFLLSLCALSSSAYSAEEPPRAEPETEQTEQIETNTDDASSEVRPDTNLRTRSLGEAFKDFTPSEEISADNAVSFPVDI